MPIHPRNGLDYGTRGSKKVYNMSGELSETDDVQGLNGGVSVAWLMKAFRMGRATVERKLIGCPTLGKGKHSVALYDLPTCAAYLVKPSEREISRVLDQIDPKDLPEHLREPFWNAKLKQQRYMRQAGELWHTDDVVDTIANLLSQIKAMLTLVPDELERDAGLSNEQRLKAKAKIDNVQNSIYKLIMGMKGSVPNQAVDFENERAAVEPEQPDDVWDFI